MEEKYKRGNYIWGQKGKQGNEKDQCDHFLP